MKLLAKLCLLGLICLTLPSTVLAQKGQCVILPQAQSTTNSYGQGVYLHADSICDATQEGCGGCVELCRQFNKIKDKFGCPLAGADGYCNPDYPAQDPDCSGQAGFMVSIFIEEELQFFTSSQLQSTSTALATQSESGVVSLSVTPCDPSGWDCLSSAAVRALRYGSFPAGTEVTFDVFQIFGLPVDATSTHCRLDRIPTMATIPYTAFDVVTAGLGLHSVTLPANEPEGIVLHCEVSSWVWW